MSALGRKTNGKGPYGYPEAFLLSTACTRLELTANSSFLLNLQPASWASGRLNLRALSESIRVVKDFALSSVSCFPLFHWPLRFSLPHFCQGTNRI